MRYEKHYDPRTQETVVKIVLSDFELSRAHYQRHDRVMLNLLEQQQREDPTLEGLLMILQQHARALELGELPSPRTTDKEWEQ